MPLNGLSAGMALMMSTEDGQQSGQHIQTDGGEIHIRCKGEEEEEEEEEAGPADRGVASRSQYVRAPSSHSPP
jgi:hypothetical protein